MVGEKEVKIGEVTYGNSEGWVLGFNNLYINTTNVSTIKFMSSKF